MHLSNAYSKSLSENSTIIDTNSSVKSKATTNTNSTTNNKKSKCPMVIDFANIFTALQVYTQKNQLFLVCFYFI